MHVCFKISLDGGHVDTMEPNFGFGAVSLGFLGFIISLSFNDIANNVHLRKYQIARG